MLARELLTEDGVICTSLDHNEIHHARLMLDDVFGPSNFIACVSVVSNPRGRQSDPHLAGTNDFMLVYGRDEELASTGGQPLTKEQTEAFSENDEAGPYRLLGLRQRGVASRREDRPDMFFPIYVKRDSLEVSLEEQQGLGWEKVLPRKSDGSDGRWMWGKKRAKEDLGLLVARLITRRDEHDVFVKDHLTKSGGERTRKYKTIWSQKEANNQAGTQEVKALLGEGIFDAPKPVALLQDVLRLGDD